MSIKLLSFASEGGKKSDPAGTQTGKMVQALLQKLLSPCTVEKTSEQTNCAHIVAEGKNREQNGNVGMQ